MQLWAFAVMAVAMVACGDDGPSGNDNNANQQQGICGDGVLNDGEACDDGPQNSDFLPDACRTNCQLATCGDSVVDSNEACDEGLLNGVSPNPCRSDCVPNLCGDGYLGGDEVCDDGNNLSGDGCRGDCGQDETLCNNGVVDPGEGCDDAGGNSDTVPDACRTDCQPARCGDHVQDSGESCDDGNTLDDLTCSKTCENFCGDNVLNPALGEECDRGADNGVSPSDCLTGCGRTTCGDGHLGGAEEGCDDHNNTDGDGCSALCQVEPRWACAGSPSVCACAGHKYGPDCTGCVVFVSLDATHPVRDGKRWASAYPALQPAIDAAHAGGPGCEVWVAAGTYYTYAGSERDTVTVRDGVAIYGGFAGSEAERGARDPARHVTVLDGRAAGGEGQRVFHVLTALGTKDATLDGLVISSGQADGLAQLIDDRGGGLLAYSAAIAVTGCTFVDNEARGAGGGIYAYGCAELKIEGCTLSGNSAGGYGGGIYTEQSSATVSHCIFASNSAGYYGGGIYNTYSAGSVSDSILSGNSAGYGGGVYNAHSSPVMSRCTFSGNSADFIGGGMAGEHSSPTVSRCLFAGNVGASGGGGLSNMANSSPTVSHCTFSGNHAGSGGGGIDNSGSSPTVTNAIVWGNTAFSTPSIYDITSSSQVVHSDIEGGFAGAGAAILDVAPGFVSPPPDTGPWDAVSFDVTHRRTALYDAGASWDASALTGLFVQPDTTDPRWLVIATNSATAIFVHGDVTGFVTAGAGYALHDLRLETGSACVDAGYGCTTPGGCEVAPGLSVPEMSLFDWTGNPVYDAGLSTPHGGAGTPAWVDLGAYEWRP